MPSASRRMYEDQLPSFMSVVDLNAAAMDEQGCTIFAEPLLLEAKEQQVSSNVSQLRPSDLSQNIAHKHHDSTSTQNSESAGSSPTTTASCTDSSSLSDPSPSSSPDSPASLLPLSSVDCAASSLLGLSSMATLNVCDTKDLDRPTISPVPRRAKNMKGLSIQPPFSSLANPSEPTSPSFIKPVIPGMKRKPSQLSLKTNATGLMARSIGVPSSPSVAPILQAPILQRRALKHSTSSPHMLSSLKSATFGPAGGMTIPTVLERNESGLSEFFRPSKPPPPPTLKSPITEEDSPIRPQIASRAVFDYEDNHEIENGEDQKTPGYPDGPIAIYDDNVYLYLEPTAEEAAKFDVVINVAREVCNPFEAFRTTETTGEDPRPGGDSPIPDTALTNMSYATAFEFFPEEDSPATPRATTFKDPEYIHIPWDHHTDIGKDLMHLCETIEQRTKDGKRVLVHCQQGASRSASLIIAYGMWLNPELSVNDAYHAAQARSRWISPNMRLMYCLQDFQKEVSKRKLALNSGLKNRTGRSPTNKHRMALSVDAIDVSPSQPLTAPLPAEDSSSNGARSPDDRSPARPRGNSTPNRGEPISPGPSSAPSSFTFSEKEDDKDTSKFGRFNLDTVPVSSQPSPGFASLGLMTAPEPPTRLPPPPPAFSRPPPSPGFADPPTSPGFGSFPRGSAAPAPLPNFSHPLSPGFPRGNRSSFKPPPSPGFNEMTLSESSPALPLGDDSFAKPPASPGYDSTFAKSPPSPGFGSHRFGCKPRAFGLVPLKLGRPRRLESPPERGHDRQIRVMRSFDDAGLLSPRLETMTNNSLREPFNKAAGLQFVEVPPTPSEGLFSPREAMFPRDPFFPFGRQTVTEDPRSPPIQGEAPIVRSIDEIL